MKELDKSGEHMVVNDGKVGNQQDRHNGVKNMLKSPSDMTIYALALVKSQVGQDRLLCNTLQVVNNMGVNNPVVSQGGNDINHIISDFVYTMRLEQCQNELDLREKEKISHQLLTLLHHS